MNEECYTEPTNHCVDIVEYPQGPFAHFCDQNEEETCSAFCGGSGNVVDSDCDHEGEYFMGGHTACALEAWIWCKCSEVA